VKRTVLLVLFLASAAHAQTAFSGFIDASFALNPNRPENHENFFPGAGTTAKRANELTVNFAQVQWTRAGTAEGPVGFTLALVAGEGADVVHGGEPGGPDKFRHVYQASLAYRLKNGVTLEAGVYPSHIGFEGFYSKDNWTYTRSIMGEASPYYQAGIKASYALNGRWSGRVDLLNGWQLINDNDDSKAIGTQIAYTSGPVAASLNTFVESDRRFVDVVVLHKTTPSLQLGGTADVGEEGDRRWYGAGLLGRYALDERNAVALRVEHFSDPDNGITGFAQTLREATLTYEARPRDNLILKLETRYDTSDADVFFERDAATGRQFLAIAGVVVTF
jgi:Putative beta-barrel porin-2, OmpL-like. bbp2